MALTIYTSHRALRWLRRQAAHGRLEFTENSPRLDQVLITPKMINWGITRPWPRFVYRRDVRTMTPPRLLRRETISGIKAVLLPTTRDLQEGSRVWRWLKRQQNRLAIAQRRRAGKAA